ARPPRWRRQELKNRPREWTARSKRSSTHLDRNRLTGSNLKASLRTLSQHNPGSDTGIRVGSHYCDSESSHSEKLGRPIPVDPNKIRHDVGRSGCTPIDEECNAGSANRLTWWMLRDDDVLRVVPRANLGDCVELESVLCESKLGGPIGLADERGYCQCPLPRAQPDLHAARSPSDGARRRVLGDDSTGGNFRIGTPHVVNLQRQPEICRHSSGFVRGAVGQVRNGDLAGSQNESHRQDCEQRVRGNQGTYQENDL